MGLDQLFATANEESDVAPEPTPEAVEKDSIGLESEDGAPEKPKAIPYPRFSEVNAKKKAAESRVLELEKALEKGKAVTEKFDSIYGKFQDPLKQLQEDSDFLSTLTSLMSDDPEVASLVQKVSKAYNTKGPSIRKMENQNDKPQGDPRVDMIVRQALSDKTEAVLEKYKVRPEVRGLISRYVTQQSIAPTEEAIRNVVKEFVESEGWTSEFLTGAPTMPKKKVTPPVLTGKNGTVAPEKEKPNNLDDLQADLKNRFRALAQERLSK